MALSVFNDKLQGSLFVVLAVFTPIAILATILRFVASRIAGKKINREDWLALGALVFFLAYVACAALVLSYLNGQTADTLSFEAVTNNLKSAYIGTLMFMPNQLCAKFSILFLYHRLFRVDRSFSIWIKVIGVAQIVYTVVTMLVSVFQCTPVDRYWNIMLDGSCIHVGPFLAAVESMNSFIDFAMVILAVLMVRKLQVSPATKIKLGVVFGLGGLAGVIGFIKIGLSFDVTVQNQLMLGLWATIQQCFSIICCCVTTYKPLLSRTGVASKISGYGSGRGKFGSRGQFPNKADDSRDWMELDGSGSRNGFVVSTIEGSHRTSMRGEGTSPDPNRLGIRVQSTMTQQTTHVV